MIVERKLDYTKEYFSRLNPDAVDFIKKMLERNVEKRASAQQLLNHPWMQRMADELEPDLDD